MLMRQLRLSLSSKIWIGLVVATTLTDDEVLLYHPGEDLRYILIGIVGDPPIISVSKLCQ